MSDAVSLEYLQRMLLEGRSPVVRFLTDVVELESYLEPGMMARLVGLTPQRDPDVIDAIFQVDEFRSHNAPLEATDYYDRLGDPRLTAREAGFGPCEHGTIGCLISADLIGSILTLVGDRPGSLYAEFAGTDPEGVSYVEWLEVEVIRLREATKASSPRQVEPR